MTISPLLILAIGVAAVLILIIALRVNAFLALITAAFLVSLLGPGEFSERIVRVAEAFGVTAGKIVIVIAMAAIIGRCLIDSGAADRIVRMFIRGLGEKRCPVALITSSGMLAPLIGSPEVMGFHPVYLACAVGFGAQCGNWMNDSGFWIFAKMSGLTEVETLKTWTVTVSSLAVLGLLLTILWAHILPLV